MSHWSLVLAAAMVTGCSAASDGDGAATADAASVGGGVEGDTSGELHGRAPGASGGVPSVVTLTPTGSEPQASNPSAPATGTDATVDQFGLAFSPRMLVVADGHPVEFTNSETALTHNVHLRSVGGDSTVFNGDTGPSEGVQVLLPGPGGYDVVCDMHPGMTSFVFVTEAPYAVAAESDGRFTMGAVPPGEYVARVWTIEGGWSAARTVTLAVTPAPLDLTSQ